MRWNACVFRLDLGLHSHPKEFWGNGVRTQVNSKLKVPSTGEKNPQRRIEPTTLHQAGQRAQHYQRGIPAFCLSVYTYTRLHIQRIHSIYRLHSMYFLMTVIIRSSSRLLSEIVYISSGPLTQVSLASEHVQYAYIQTCTTLEAIEMVPQLTAGTVCLFVGC